MKMKYYESIVIVNVPCTERYKLRMKLESLVKETYLRNLSESTSQVENVATPRFSYLVEKKDEMSAVVKVRAATPIGLAYEQESLLSLVPGKKMLLRFSCCTETNHEPTGGKRRCWQGDELINLMAIPRLEKAGFKVESIEIKGFEKVDMDLRRGRSWFLQGAFIEAIVTVQDVSLAEAALVLGVSKKRSFGFGFMRFTAL